jgi:hypothetical protein
VTNLDIDHNPLERDTPSLEKQGKGYVQTRVRGEGGTFSITRVYTNESGEPVVDCAGSGRRISKVTLDRLERP